MEGSPAGLEFGAPLLLPSISSAFRAEGARGWGFRVRQAVLLVATEHGPAKSEIHMTCIPANSKGSHSGTLLQVVQDYELLSDIW